MMDEVDKLIAEVERMYNEVMAMEGSPPVIEARRDSRDAKERTHSTFRTSTERKV